MLKCIHVTASSLIWKPDANENNLRSSQEQVRMTKIYFQPASLHNAKMKVLQSIHARLKHTEISYPLGSCGRGLWRQKQGQWLLV